MADAEAPQDVAPKKASKKPLILGLVLAIVGGGAGFYATWSGMLGGAAETAADSHGEGGTDDHTAALPAVAFVPITPVVISLGRDASSRHLRMTAQLEVGPPFAAEVTHLLPRILDVLNGYLRAIDVAELENPSGLVRIRAQLLRRIQIVTGEGRVQDLLITEFVLN
jgi:flagellar protein FliL